MDKRKPSRAHPAVMAARSRKGARAKPTELDKRIQKLKHSTAVNTQTFEGTDGPGAGCLRTGAEEQTAQLMEAWGITGEENHARILAYLFECYGEISHAFPHKPNLPGFFEHNQLDGPTLEEGEQ